MKDPAFRPFQNYEQRTEAQIVHDLNVAHDRIRILTQMHNADLAKADKRIHRLEQRLALYGWLGVLFFVSSVMQWLAIVALSR